MKNPILLLSLTALPISLVAADLSGTWKSEFDSQIGQQKYTYTLKQDGTLFYIHEHLESARQQSFSASNALAVVLRDGVVGAIRVWKMTVS